MTEVERVSNIGPAYLFHAFLLYCTCLQLVTAQMAAPVVVIGCQEEGRLSDLVQSHQICTDHNYPTAKVEDNSQDSGDGGSISNQPSGDSGINQPSGDGATIEAFCIYGKGSDRREEVDCLLEDNHLLMKLVKEKTSVKMCSQLKITSCTMATRLCVGSNADIQAKIKSKKICKSGSRFYLWWKDKQKNIRFCKPRQNDAKLLKKVGNRKLKSCNIKKVMNIGTPATANEENCMEQVNACSGHGKCVETVKKSITTYSCVCLPAYKGTFCEIEKDKCNWLSCKSGKCKAKSSLQKMFRIAVEKQIKNARKYEHLVQDFTNKASYPVIYNRTVGSPAEQLEDLNTIEGNPEQPGNLGTSITQQSVQRRVKRQDSFLDQVIKPLNIHVFGDDKICVCSSGFIGEDCKTECPRGTYGELCMYNCSMGCIDGVCDRLNGRCDCESVLYQGKKCDRLSKTQLKEKGRQELSLIGVSFNMRVSQLEDRLDLTPQEESVSDDLASDDSDDDDAWSIDDLDNFGSPAQRWQESATAGTQANTMAILHMAETFQGVVNEAGREQLGTTSGSQDLVQEVKVLLAPLNVEESEAKRFRRQAGGQLQGIKVEFDVGVLPSIAKELDLQKTIVKTLRENKSKFRTNLLPGLEVDEASIQVTEVQLLRDDGSDAGMSSTVLALVITAAGVGVVVTITAWFVWSNTQPTIIKAYHPSANTDSKVYLHRRNTRSQKQISNNSQRTTIVSQV